MFWKYEAGPDMMLWWFDDMMIQGYWAMILSNDLFHVYIQRRDNGWPFPAFLDINCLEKRVGRKVFLLHGQIWANVDFVDLHGTSQGAQLAHTSAVRKKTVLVWHKHNSKSNVLKGKRQNINLSCFHLSNKRNQQQKSWFCLNTWSFMDWSRKYVSVTLREEYNFLDQQKRCFFSLKFIYISNKIFLKQFLNKNSYSKKTFETPAC